MPAAGVQVSCPSVGEGSTHQCIYPWGMCDGYANCGGGGDEDPDFCATYQCSPGYVSCRAGPAKCVYGQYCDGFSDCPVEKGKKVSSDEDPAFCEA